MGNKPTGLGTSRLIKYGVSIVVGTVAAMIARPYIKDWITHGPIEQDILDEEIAYDDLMGFESTKDKKRKKKKGED